MWLSLGKAIHIVQRGRVNGYSLWYPGSQQGETVLNKPHFKTCVLVVALASMPILSQAAGLGRLNVLSGLGQPFKGEIELVSVQPSELETLAVRLASVENYAAAQLGYPDPALGLRLSLDKRESGLPVIRITSAGAIDEPVFNLLVDLSWVGGKIQREYTALLDPTGYKAPVAVGAASRVESGVLPGRLVSSVIQSPMPLSPSARPARVVASAPASVPDRYSVKAGDTLSSIARVVQPDGVSLEQVIVGLYQANPDAFSGNMNRLKRGKILQIPKANELVAVNKPAAIREIRAQSADWQSYRRQLSEAVAKTPATDVGAPVSGGRITTQVEDKAVMPGNAEKDVLKLSKGAGKAEEQSGRVKMLEEEVAARKKALEDANQRVTELQKNIQQMEALAALQSQTGAALQQKAEQALPSASAPVAESASPVSASVPVQDPKPKPKRVLPSPPPPEPSMMDVLMDNIMPVGGGLAAVLLGVAGLIWSRRRRQPDTFENSLITSGDLKPNTVLGRTGGGVISTQAENSFLTDFSRQGLGTIDTDEVDPIAEADVYMAYGRDIQAEEILKDALLKDPERQEIRLKLLDIYAARKDRVAFEEIAADLFAATAGKGPLWEQASFQGRNLDPDNALYAQKNQGVGSGVSSAAMVAGAAAAIAASTAVGNESDVMEKQAEPVSVHDDTSDALDFEFEIPEESVEPEPVKPTEWLESAETTLSDIDLELTSAETTLDRNEPKFDIDVAELGESAVPVDLVPDLAVEADLEPLSDEKVIADDGLMMLDLPIDFSVDLQEPEPDVESVVLPVGALAEEVSFGGEPATEVEMPSFELSDIDLDLMLDKDEVADAPEVQAGDLAGIAMGLHQEPMPVAKSVEVQTEVDELIADEIDLDFDFNMDEEQVSPTEKSTGEPLSAPIDLDLEMGEAAAAEMDYGSEDPVQTKIDLAQAYIDMGDVEGAREILQEAVQEGSPAQQEFAKSLLANL